MIKVLEGKKVLICRPEPAASELSTVLNSVGADCHVLPCIDISPIALAQEAKQSLLDLDKYDDVIVVSQHAATLGLAHVEEYWPQFPYHQRWFAIGRKTADCLKSEALELVEPEADLSSEDLLSLPQLSHVQDRKVLILKGVGGRQKIEKQLKERGAQVDTLALYERILPDHPAKLVQEALETFQADYIVALSGETLLNLFALSESANITISNYKFILSSQRVANLARERGCRDTFIPDNLKPIDIIRCIAKADRSNK